MRTIDFLGLCCVAGALSSCGESTAPPEAPASAAAAKLPSITVVNLGTLPGGGYSAASGINARGDIVGTARTASGEDRAVVWRNGTITDLGTLGGTFSQGRAIDAAGRIVGLATRAGGPEGTEYAFLWEDGRMTDLGVPPGGSYSVGLGINPRGEVVAYTDVGLATWSRGRWTVLPDPEGGSNCSGGAIDNAGFVVGFCSVENDQTRSFIWERGVPTNLGSMGNGSIVAATAISPSHVVVGSFSTEHGARPFMWKHGTMTELTARGADATFGPAAINGAGLIAGIILPGNSRVHAALWREGTTIDLGALPGGTDSYAYGINTSGQVVGASVDASRGYRAVLWTVH